MQSNLDYWIYRCEFAKKYNFFEYIYKKTNKQAQPTWEKVTDIS